MKQGSVRNCLNYVQVTVNEDMVGGITGYNIGTISQSHNYGQIGGVSSVGGICGMHGEWEEEVGTTHAYNPGIFIEDCYNYGNVNGSYCIGGIIGLASNGRVLRCKNENVAKVESTGNDYASSEKYWSRTRRNCGIYSGQDISGF